MYPPRSLLSSILAFVSILLITAGLILNGNALISFLNHRFINSSPGKSVEEPVRLSESNIDLNRNEPLIGPQLKETQLTLEPGFNSSDNRKLGHFQYPIEDEEQMILISSYAQGENQRFEKLLPDAAKSLMKLIYAARDEGVWIVPVSAFRDLDRQEELFERQVQKLGSQELAAKVSAPPGYSEHHTGYAIDLADGRFPKQDITLEFAKTSAFQWLQAHALEFGFELSFPHDNPQGVSYEPWHWRFIGSQKSRGVFGIEAS